MFENEKRSSIEFCMICVYKKENFTIDLIVKITTCGVVFSNQLKYRFQ